jgi:hypothetical protein
MSSLAGPALMAPSFLARSSNAGGGIGTDGVELATLTTDCPAASTSIVILTLVSRS